MRPFEPVPDFDPDLGAAQAACLQLLARGGDRQLLGTLVRLLAAAHAAGDVCLDLAELAGRSPAAGEPPLPDVQALRAALAATGLVGSSAAPTSDLPLVLDDQHRLYSRRHHRDERTLAAAVRARLQAAPLSSPDEVRAALAALDLLPARGAAVDWQLAAVVAAATRSLAVLCGGPGTGKTTTIARLLAVLLHIDPGLRIALAAPTGKAAARLGEALAQEAGRRPSLAGILPHLQARTLHRLLGYLPLEDRCRHGADQPLPYDLVVVDEASMADPALLAQLCRALPAAARLLLVGDQHQLAAIAPGQVLGDLCRAARPERGAGPALAAAVAAATGMALPVQPDAAPLADVTIALVQNHRFARQPGIGAFAAALLRGDAAAALAAIDAGNADLSLAAAGDALAHFEPIALELCAAAERGDPAAALAIVGRGRVLTALRHGPDGAAAWNARIAARLARHGHRAADSYSVGRPVLVTQNDHQNQIWNGDLGVVGRGAAGQPVVWLPGPTGEPRAIAVGRLPAHETAWATTVHKAQGSEFDFVLLALPDRPGPLLHAALVYTAVTRARQQALLVADRTLLAAALADWPVRTSGLAAALAGPG